MCFVERSIPLIEEHWLQFHKCSGFRSTHHLSWQYCFVWPEIVGSYNNFEPYMKTVAINDDYSWSLKPKKLHIYTYIHIYIIIYMQCLKTWSPDNWIEQTNTKKDNRLTSNRTFARLLRTWMIILTFFICFSPTMKWNVINSSNAHTINKLKKPPHDRIFTKFMFTYGTLVNFPWACLLSLRRILQ